MTRLVWTLCLLLGVLGVRGQSVADPLAMCVGDRDVRLSELVFSLKEAGVAPTQKAVEAYVPTYVNRLLMAQAARDARLDTTARFKRAYGAERRQLLVEALVDSSMLETSLKNYYNHWAKNCGKDGVIRLSHIFIPLSQTGSTAEQHTASQRIDSIYRAIQGGADFEMLAARYAPGVGSLLLGGATETWMGKGETFAEFEQQAYALGVGEVSAPFLSTVGYHIVKVLEKKYLETYAAAREEMLHSERFMAQMRKQTVALVVAQRGNGVSVRNYLEQQEKRLMENNVGYAARLQTFADGLLQSDYTNAEVLEKIPRDEAAFQAYLSGDASARKSFKKLVKKYKKKKEYNASECAKKQLLVEYQTALETRLSADLRRKYKVAIYQDVIKTVYKH